MSAEYSSPACFMHEVEVAEGGTAGELVTIYHNPGCGKSRAALALLEASGVPIRIVEYLKTPPDAAQLAALVAQLGIQACDLLRKGEPVFVEIYAGRALSEADCIAAMVAHPILIERPIAVRGARAVIGRPPENLEKLLRA